MGKIKNWLNNILPSGSFIRNSVTLMTGTTFAQALSILVAPILTRIYSPEDFGVLALYTSILGILVVIASLRYESAILLPEKDEDAINILALSILICIGLSLIILILVAFFRYQVSAQLGTSELAFWLWFLPLSFFIAGLFQVFSNWNTRKKQFKHLAIRLVTQSAVTAVTQISIGATNYNGAGGLISGSIAGQAIATGRLIWQIWKDEGYKFISVITIRSIKYMAVRYNKFPKYDSWSALLNSSSNLLPALLLAYFFNPFVLGLYALGNRVLAVPTSVIGSAVSQVFFQRAAEARRSGDLDQVTFKMFNNLLKISIVPFLLIAVTAPDLFKIVFGAEWYVAGEYLRWLSISILLSFVSSPISSIYTIMERQREGMIIYQFVFIIRSTALIIGGMTGDPLFAIAIFGATEALFRLFNCCYILHLVGIPVSQTLISFAKQFIYSIPYLLIPLFLLVLIGDSLLFVVAGIVAGILFVLIKAYQVNKSGDF